MTSPAILPGFCSEGVFCNNKHILMESAVIISDLQARVARLEEENAMLRRDFGALGKGAMVTVPAPFRPLFDAAQAEVSDYFRNLKMNPTQGTIEINEQRYVLVRASALSKDFLDTIQRLYADRGAREAMSIGKNFLFDIAHVIGMNDARAFHHKMKLTEPIARLSAGPIHFAYSGWAFVEILPDSNPSPDEHFYLHYHHPYSFEADSWLRAGEQADTAVCIMNAGYSSGWCEESFGIPLTSVEVSCRAKGDTHCSFIMSPPDRIEEHLARFQHQQASPVKDAVYEIPTFFERKRVEEELQRARDLAEETAKAKSDFMANISHELRTPLGAILGFADLLQKTGLSVVQQDYLQAIHTSGANLLSIINDVLDLSKLDAGRFAIESVPFSVPELMHSLEVMFTAKAAAKGLQLTCTSDLAITHHVLGDPMRLTQILINLVGNAIKFTERGMVQAHCRLEREESGMLHLHLIVRDTGIGIQPEEREHIFERFTQADTNITRKYGGTGLGLAITKELVELQGGTIALESVPGKGTTFHVRLAYPAVTDWEAAAAIPEATGLVYEVPKRILVVEDNYMNQKLTEILLQNNGFHAAIAENGAVAVELLRKAPYDLVLMDIQMPVMDGYKATQVIREELRLRTPIIAMTAHALDGEREACISRGMNDYISKPFREAELLRKMHYWLAQDTGSNADGLVVDLGFLKQQTRGNKTFILEMIRFFKAHIAGELQLLKGTIDAGDFEGIYKKTHQLRNSTALFGLNRTIGVQMQQMESFGRAGNNLDKIAALYEEIVPVFEQAVRELSGPGIEI
jgi:signal transduction histidine kinase/DNA-binding NarL/FixJ family response regulator